MSFPDDVALPDAAPQRGINVFAFQLRAAIEAAPMDGLPAVSQLLYAAMGAGGVSEAEAETLDALIRARTTVRQAAPRPAPRARPGSRPRSDESMGRRRRWAAAGRLPPQIAAKFTQAEVAVLAVIAAEVARRGDHRLAHGHVAAIAGVSKSTVRATLRRARVLGLITSQERRLSRFRSDPNIVKIIDPSWLAWMRLARRDDRPRGGDISVSPTNTGSFKKGRKDLTKARKKLPGQQDSIHNPGNQGANTGSESRMLRP